MSASISLPASATTENPVLTRIVRQARAHFFSHGYSQCTMDELAADLGMSKKTLYVHFASKEALMRAVLEDLGREVRASADELFANRQLNFAEKLRGFAEGMAERMARMNPRLLRDLQRFAPPLYAQLSELREKNVPYIFGRFIEEGQLAGLVRTDLRTDFAVMFFLQAMQGLLNPATMDRLGLAPREIAPRAIELLFAGLLTHAGRQEHEKLFPR
ncbi:MAG TPA: TetR/AcrR family transcriptional regulator [Lacunisphaera sp.]